MAKPKIRFNGYTEDWEQRKLGEVFKEYSEKNHTELPALTIIHGNESTDNRILNLLHHYEMYDMQGL